ncbi:MAG: PfkB family carbohydrate kinase, partial [Nitrososphaerales archaeon]
FVAGHVAIDQIIDSRYSAPRESLGGALCYSTICLKSLGYKSEIITKIGKDFPKEYARFLLSNAEIDVERWRAQDCKTTRYTIDRARENERQLWLVSKCRNLQMKDFIRAIDMFSGRSRLLIVNSIAGEITFSLLERIVEEFDHVYLDSQGFVRKFNKHTGKVTMKPGLDISSLSGIDVLKTDSEELFALTGVRDKETSIRKLSKVATILLVTAGSGNVELYEDGRIRLEAKPLQTTVKDTTGAGDIMLSSFIARNLETDDLEDALLFSVSAASLSVRNVGIEKAILSRSEVLEEAKKVRIVQQRD